VQRCEELRRVSPAAIPPHFPAETMKDSRQSVESGSQKLQDAVVVSVVAVPGRVIDASPALITGPWLIDACSVRGKEAFASAADEPPLQQNQRCRRGWLTSCGCCPAARWPSRSRWCRPAGYPRGRPQPTSLNGLPRGRGLFGHSSRHNHQYRSNSFGEPRDHRIPCGERYGHGTRYRHRREVVCCPALRL
jgi:hypothetical protein